MKHAWLVLIAMTGAWAQPSFAPPQLGFIQDGARTLRPLYGVTGDFVLGPSITGDIQSEAFSGSIGLVKTDSLLAAFDAAGKFLTAINTSAGPALFAFSPDGRTALAYIASSHQLVEWRSGEFVLLPANCQPPKSESPIAIALPNPTEAVLFVERRETVWELQVSLDSPGPVTQRAVIGVHAPLLPLPSGDVVYRDRSDIVIRRGNATEVRVAGQLPPQFSLQLINANWVELSDLVSPARFAIHTLPGRERIYRLPEGNK
jgi:hypothetical protein